MEQMELSVPHIIYYVHRKCYQDWVIETRLNDFHDLTYVAAGSGVYLVDDKAYPVGEGSLIYIPPDRKRQAWTDPENLMEVYAVNFFAERTLPFDIVSPLGHDPKLTSLFTQLTRIWMEREELYMLDAGALTLQIICELYRRLCMNKPVNQLDERIEKIKNYINENYNVKLSLSALAKLVGLSPVYLGALFAQKESCSVKEYINKVRVQNAYEIMRTERLPVNNVALDCGYTDAFYFSRVFKKYMGVSPSKV